MFFYYFKLMLSFACRSGPLNAFNDVVFQSEINLKIQETDEFYNKMLFKEALRTGFFELQTARDKYRELSLDGMHLDLVLKFIEVQALLMAPICPHVAEYVWKLLGKNTSVVKSEWPKVGTINEIFIKSSEYLMETAHSFRVHLKTHLQGIRTKAHPNPPPVPKPNVVNIWVAKTFPSWQSCILTVLKNHYVKNKCLPDNKTLSIELGSKDELKKYMKRVMPFVQTTREKLERLGLKALALTLEFNEADVLKNNCDYLANTLDVEEVIVKSTDDKDATEKMKECCPGIPFVQFSVKPGVKLEFNNPIPLSGLFSYSMTISDGDSYNKIVQRMVRDIKLLKSPQSIQLWRYEDPVLGDCKIPFINEPTKDKVLIPIESTFKVDLEEKKVSVVVAGSTKSYLLGNTVTYLCVN